MRQITEDDIEQAFNKLNELQATRRQIEQDYGYLPNQKNMLLHQITAQIEGLKIRIQQAQTQVGSRGNSARWHS